MKKNRFYSYFFLALGFILLLNRATFPEQNLRVVAMVNQSPIFQYEVDEFSRQFLLDARRLYGRNGHQIAEDLIIEALILKKLLLQEAKRLNIPLFHPGVILNVEDDFEHSALTPSSFRHMLIKAILVKDFHEFVTIKEVINSQLIASEFKNKSEFLDYFEKKLLQKAIIEIKGTSIVKNTSDDEQINPVTSHVSGLLAIGSGTNINHNHTTIPTQNLTFNDNFYALQLDWGQKVPFLYATHMNYGLSLDYQIYHQYNNYNLSDQLFYWFLNTPGQEGFYPYVSFTFGNTLHRTEFFSLPQEIHPYTEYTFKIPYHFSIVQSSTFQSEFFYHFRDYTELAYLFDYKEYGIKLAAYIPILLSNFQIQIKYQFDLQQFSNQPYLTIEGVTSTTNAKREDSFQVIELSLGSMSSTLFSGGYRFISDPISNHYFSQNGNSLFVAYEQTFLKGWTIQADISYTPMQYPYKRITPLTQETGTANATTEVLPLEYYNSQQIDLKLSRSIISDILIGYIQYHSLSIDSNNLRLDGASSFWKCGFRWELDPL